MKYSIPIALAFALAGAALAHVRLVHPGNGNPLVWSSPSNVSVVIQKDGSDDIADGSHFTALRNAFDAWSNVSGSDVRLVEDKSASEQARTDWGETDIHLVLFDENDASGYFPVGSGTVAITPIWFDSAGTIVDADILFNGQGFHFTTKGQGGFFDVGDVATHELGHLLGLDHSGWAGASMYPYVSPAVVEHRSLSDDEVRGLRHSYPTTTFATITGTVRRASNNSVVSGAHVVARDANGRTAASVLTTGSGNFTLRGLDAGTYTLYATPLDYPVSAANVSVSQAIQTDFQSTLGATVAVSAGGSQSSGDLLVGPDTTLSLGRNQDRFPLRAIAGTTGAFLVRGSGLDAGCTLAASDPTIVVSNPNWMSAMVGFDVTVPAGAPDGHADLVVTDGLGNSSILPGALEITPPSPVVASLSVASGSITGGTPITITGSNFRAGARVVIGARIYEDGQANGCTVASASSISLTTLATAAGTYDVVVMDPTGEEGRKSNAFQFQTLPTIASVFPSAGSQAGGTHVTLRGANFLAGMQVRIDGVTQAQVTWLDASTCTVTTDPGIAGGPYVLEVENPAGEIATSAFSYSASADPQIAVVTPAKGSTGGGKQITISGANFAPGASVYFGADALSGLGGTPAASVTFVDASTLQVVTPAHAKGKVAVLVQSGAPGQSSLVDAAFTFQADSGGGGGGCSTRFVAGPPDPRDAIGNAGPLLAAFVLLCARALRARRRAVATA